MMQKIRGFTLLEILIVITIISLSISIIAPNMYKTIESMQKKSELSLRIKETNERPLIIMLSGKNHMGSEIVYKSNGFCLGGTVKDGSEDTITLNPPFCRWPK